MLAYDSCRRPSMRSVLPSFARAAVLCLAAGLAARPGGGAPKPIRLFDGKSFQGWEGDTAKTWRIVDRALVGGSVTETVPHNEFLCTTREYGDFVLRAKVKLAGVEGFVNGGIQIRSQRIADPPYEMTGYQVDMGEGYWGCLYDESRRNKILAQADPAVIKRVLKPNGWNEYEIRCEGKRIRIRLNGEQTVDYTEMDPNIPLTGRIAVQVHGNGKTEASYKDLVLEELK
jgi:hypothetical protein